MPEKKESILDTNETVNKDNANSCSSDFQGSPEEKKDVATDQHSGKKDGQKNTKIIKRIIKGVKKDKNDPLRFVDGVNFRGKLIGVEEVNDARGDRICQDSLQKLKAIVKSSGEHKQKVLLNISFQGIKISDEKNSEIIYQHPVHMISFTSLDVNDNRAFGYICGTTEEGHKFVGIKTEKAACQVVLTLQDLFQAVLEKKKQAMESAKQLQFSKKSNDDEKKEMENNNKNKNVKSEQKADEKENSESIYSDVISSSSVENVPPENNKSVSSLPKPQSNVDDLLCLQLEVDKLQENIEQMDSSMAAVSELNYPFMPDPFNTSTFVLYPQKDIYESAASTSSSEDQSVGSPFPDSKVNQKSEETSSFYVTYSDNDKYSVFSNIDTISSIFENSQSSLATTNQDDEQINVSTSDSTQTNSQASPPKPPRLPQNDLFADLDPLVLKDLVDKTISAFTSEPTKFYTSQSAPESTEVSTCFQSYDATCPPFSCDFNNISTQQTPSHSSNSLPSSLPNSSKRLSSFPLNDNKSKDKSSGNPFTENTTGTVILPPPPPLPPRLTNRSSEPNIQFPLSLKSESAIYASPTSASSGNVPLNYRRGSLPANQVISEFSQNNTSISANSSSSHPIPIPTRKLPVNSQQTGSYNGQNHNGESKKLARSFEQESPNVDFFGCGFGESLNNPNQTCSFVENQELNHSLQKSNKKNQVINKTSLNNSTEKTFILPPPESQIKLNNLTKFKKMNGIVNDNSTTKLSPISRLPGVTSQYQVLSEICLQNGNMSSCSESTDINSNNSSMSNSGNIFNRKKDPFADDFFAALPKKLNGYQSVPNEL
ncbi:uncharacterized protein [Centruroides vittatus]|uniref:uncharacterized protein isoform X2 n=1 Tax=Centruroides vittatus TaxID=120091 RepID=UPI00350F9694